MTAKDFCLRGVVHFIAKHVFNRAPGLTVARKPVRRKLDTIRQPPLQIPHEGIGAVVIFILEWKASAIKPADTEIFESLPKGFAGIKSYEQLVALEIHPPRKSSKNQLPLFSAFPETTSVNSIRTLYDNGDKEIAAVNCDRFSALLITYLLDNLDNATEKSLRAGLSRFGELGKGDSDIKMFVHDKTIREANHGLGIKSLCVTHWGLWDSRASG